ncbi:GTPase HRas-like isoform X2 [Mustela erminea]|uniref:GTPase HRas-like isoform X2 n=1 Tax=Mustela erminea TaxID=36723 RepID=UPI00138700E1|nr:GTPase HRas-like isoform X2 [Mustela erminea]
MGQEASSSTGDQYMPTGGDLLCVFTINNTVSFKDFQYRSWIRPCLQHDNQFPPSSLQGADGTAGSEGFQGKLGLQRQDSLGHPGTPGTQQSLVLT